MQVSLNAPQLEKFIQQQIDRGNYSSATEVVETALQRLMLDEFAPGELDRLIAEGEASLIKHGPIKADDVFKKLRQMSEKRRSEMSR